MHVHSPIIIERIFFPSRQYSPKRIILIFAQPSLITIHIMLCVDVFRLVRCSAISDLLCTPRLEPKICAILDVCHWANIFTVFRCQIRARSIQLCLYITWTALPPGFTVLRSYAWNPASSCDGVSSR